MLEVDESAGMGCSWKTISLRQGMARKVQTHQSEVRVFRGRQQSSLSLSLRRLCILDLSGHYPKDPSVLKTLRHSIP